MFKFSRRAIDFQPHECIEGRTMKTFQTLVAAAVLAASNTANAWWGPFNWGDDDYYSDNHHSDYGQGQSDGYGDADGDAELDGEFNADFKFSVSGSGRGSGRTQGRNRYRGDYRGDHYGKGYIDFRNGYYDRPYGYAPQRYAPVAPATPLAPAAESLATDAE